MIMGFFERRPSQAALDDLGGQPKAPGYNYSLTT